MMENLETEEEKKSHESDKETDEKIETSPVSNDVSESQEKPPAKKRTHRMMLEGTGLLLASLLGSNDGNTKNEENEESEESEEDEKKIETETSSQGLPCETDNLQVKESETGASNENNRQVSDSQVPSTSTQNFISYNFEKPKLLCAVRKHFNCHTGSPQKYGNNNFLKGCKWSPCGSFILTNSEDKKLRVFSLKSDVFVNLYQGKVPESISESDEVCLLSASNQGDLVYDYAWFPFMYGVETNDCLYAVTSRDHPIHLREGFTGEIRATYRPINHLDEMCSAHCLCFNWDGNKLYSGFTKGIRLFDLSIPGREFQFINTRNKNFGGQTGIISCIAMSPKFPKSYAASSYGKTIGLYTENSKEVELVFEAHGGGITHLQFSACGNYLYSGGRRDENILCWDMRNVGNVFRSFKRRVATNQRVYFQLDQRNEYLVSGGSGGEVRIWNLKENQKEMPEPSTVFSTGSSTCNGISLNPGVPLLATGTGQRIFPIPLDSDSDSNEENDKEYERRNPSTGLDNSLSFWYVGR